jgi:hypothetical protein
MQLHVKYNLLSEAPPPPSIRLEEASSVKFIPGAKSMWELVFNTAITLA